MQQYDFIVDRIKKKNNEAQPITRKHIYNIVDATRNKREEVKADEKSIWREIDIDVENVKNFWNERKASILKRIRMYRYSVMILIPNM